MIALSSRARREANRESDERGIALRGIRDGVIEVLLLRGSFGIPCLQILIVLKIALSEIEVFGVVGMVVSVRRIGHRATLCI